MLQMAFATVVNYKSKAIGLVDLRHFSLANIKFKTDHWVSYITTLGGALRDEVNEENISASRLTQVLNSKVKYKYDRLDHASEPCTRLR